MNLLSNIAKIYDVLGIIMMKSCSSTPGKLELIGMTLSQMTLLRLGFCGNPNYPSDSMNHSQMLLLREAAIYRFGNYTGFVMPQKRPMPGSLT